MSSSQSYGTPIFSISTIQTPLILLHGVGAPLLRCDASRLIVGRLEMNYKPFVLKTYPNENYYERGREKPVTLPFVRVKRTVPAWPAAKAVNCAPEVVWL
jgi:hypothetical protein